MARSMGRSILHKATDITAILVTGTWLSALFLGYDWWLPALLFGYIAVLPLVDLLTDGDSSSDADDESAWTDEQTSAAESDDQPDSTSQDALDTLRDRYARGELTDEQFERKLERLLETESMEDVEDRARETERA
ncbi:SHOCT domain-containing protein [Haloferax sp. S1W]|uniref:SHOCT domain-containing protein n=1 Tax=Haloferax sp. S1W TaxID=3377110 RepID=UPI0037C68B96